MERFLFGGKGSDDFFLTIEKGNTMKRPERLFTAYQVPGRSREVVVERGYSNVEISYLTWVLEKNRDGALGRLEELTPWLDGVEYRKLTDTYDPDFFRLGYCSKPLEPEVLLKRAAKQEIVFSCDPYRYLWEGEKEENFLWEKVFFNRWMESLPIVTIEAAGRVKLSFIHEKKSWSALLDVTSKLTLDSFLMETKEAGEAADDQKTGPGYPSLLPGETTVKLELISGHAYSAEIKPRWRTL